jgi:DNA-binding Lrp family transcriptional regulator
MSKFELDATDRELLNRLQANARATTTELARALGFSRSAVQERVRKLERLGVIVGYRAILSTGDEETHAGAQVLISIDPKRSAAVVKSLEALPEVSACYAVSGDYDLLAMIRAPTLEDVDAVLDEIGGLDGVYRTRSVVLLAAKFVRPTA